MKLLQLAFDYHKTPMGIRERVAFSKADQVPALQKLKSQKAILECAILSTCNRTEIFALVDQIHTGRYYLQSFLGEWFGLDWNQLSPFATYLEGDQVVSHLYALSCGMESQILGETQILGQLKRSYEKAIEADTIGTIYHYLFQHAFAFAKKMQIKYQLNTQPRSVAYAVAQMIQSEGNCQDKSLLLMGLGEVGLLMARHLQGLHFARVDLANRTYQKAQDLALALGRPFHPLGLEEGLQELASYDIVISALASPQLVIQRHHVPLDTCQPALWFDLGLPRTIDPHLSSPNRRLVTIDQINGQLLEEEKRLVAIKESIQADSKVEVEAFDKWLASSGVNSVIDGLRKKQLGHLAKVEESLYQKLPDLSPREKKIISKHLKSLVNAMLKEPIMQTKELIEQDQGTEKLEWTKQVFGLKDKSSRVIRLGSRGSQLALAQTRQVVAQLEQAWPNYTFEIVVVKTQGDLDQTSPLSQIGGKGVFIKTIEDKLLKGEIDLAVHSSKDLPALLPPGCMIGAVPVRQEVTDILVFRQVHDLDQLPQGAKVGTGSLRRAQQLLLIRPDLEIIEIRGNVDTRIRKMEEAGLDAIVLAKAGLNRLDYFAKHSQLLYQDLPLELCLPAVGQGALALECRSQDKEIIEILGPLNHGPSQEALEEERTYLSLWGADCSAAIGCYVTKNDHGWLGRGLIQSPQSGKLYRLTLDWPQISAMGLGKALYQALDREMKDNEGSE